MLFKSRYGSIIALALLVSACGGGNEQTTPQTAPETPPAPILSTLADYNTALSRPAEVEISPQLQATLLLSNWNIGLSRLKAEIDSDHRIRNFVSAPLQIGHQLALLGVGSRSSSYDAILSALHIDPTDLPDTLSHNALAYASAEWLNKDYLSVNGILFGQHDYQFSVNYLDILSSAFNPTMQSLDFLNSNAAVTINDWFVQQEPLASIPSSLSSARSRLVHATVMKVNAAWSSDTANMMTVDGKFEFKNKFGTIRQNIVPMLKISGAIPFYANASYEAFELDMLDKGISLLIIMPQHAEFNTTMSQLSVESLSQLDMQLVPTETAVYLPMFRTSSALRYGIPELVFNETQADFSGINLRGDLFLKQLGGYTELHIDDANLTVDSTSVATLDVSRVNGTNSVNGGVSFSSGYFTEYCYDPPQARPFIFIVRDRSNKHILYIGKTGQLYGLEVTPNPAPIWPDPCP